MALAQGTTHTTITDAQGCYRVDGVDVIHPSTITMSVPAQL
jgi:hypothetical protein